MLGALTSGLSANSQVMDPQNAGFLLAALSAPVQALKQHLNYLESSEKTSH